MPFREHWAVLGVPLRPVQAATGSLRTAMLLWFPFLAASLAVGVWFIVGRTLRPVAAAREREEQLVADVSHELRNPLAGLRVLLETEAHAPGEVALSRIEALSTLGRLEAVADQLLVVTRQEHRTGRTAGQPVDLDDVVLGQVRGLALRSPVRVDTSAVRSGQVVGREHDLAGLVENLVTNAVRHARSVVRVGVHERAGTVELAVDDDGPGVDPADRERIFERFTRLDEARSRDQGGAGLGLAIVRAIVDAHDGSIEVEDSALGGARFVVRLPAGTPGGG